jgi:hypothetical protein
MPVKRQTLTELRDLYRLAGSAIMRRLDDRWKTQRTWLDGRRRTADVVSTFIKPNDRLTSLERIQIYNRQYWFRLIDCLYEDYPGLQAAIGQGKFSRLLREYLDANPSRSFTLRNLGSRLEQFVVDHPQLTAPRTELAIEMARFEWAQVVAFDGPARPALGVDELLGTDPERLTLAVQPYITLLELNWPLDDWSIALKKSQRAMRSEASNAVETADEPRKKRRRFALPKRQKTLLAVHRYDNSIYYKRLEPDTFAVLSRLAAGKSLAEACAPVPEAMAERVQQWFANWTTLGWFCRRAGGGGGGGGANRSRHESNT